MGKKTLIWICLFCIVFAFLFGMMGYRLTANDKTAVSILLFVVGIAIAIGVSLFTYSIAVQVGKEIVMRIVFVILCIILCVAVFSIPNAQSNGGNENDCRNCGRPRMSNSVYCEDCFESYYEWSQDYYDDKYN